VGNECERMWKDPVMFYFERLSRDCLDGTEENDWTLRIIVYGLGTEARNFVSHYGRKNKQTARDSTVQCELGCLN